MGRWKRAEMVAEWFGVHRSAVGTGAMLADFDLAKLRRLLPQPGRILLISGPSGSGKSTLLRRCRRMLGRRCIDLEQLALPRRPVIELFGGMRIEDALGLLSQFGLAEAHTYLLRPAKLSAGQQWRLRLAMAMASARFRHGEACLVCDEFANPLDRITAAVVAHALRRTVDRTTLSAIVASTREDLARSLRPDAVVECDFGEARVKWNHR